MLKVDVYQGGKEVRVRFPARTWEKAHDVIEGIREDPPDGYKLTDSRVAPKGKWRGGRRCNVRLTLTYCDSRFPMFTEQEATEFFRDDVRKANEREEENHGSEEK